MKLQMKELSSQRQLYQIVGLNLQQSVFNNERMLFIVFLLARFQTRVKKLTLNSKLWSKIREKE